MYLYVVNLLYGILRKYPASTIEVDQSGIFQYPLGS